MEIDKRPPEIGKKLWNIVRIVLYMARRSNAKRRIMVELNMLVKKGRNAAGKAISNLILHHHRYSALTCRSNDITSSFVSPRYYEFSCSNTPIYASKRKNHAEEELKLMHKVFGILSRYDVAVEATSMSPLPRATDSPLSIKDAAEEENGVDKDAEEFINKFYRELKKQKPIAAALESPSPYHEWA